MRSDDIYEGYVLYECGKFVFYSHAEDMSGFCPECGAGPVRGETFEPPIPLALGRAYVKRDVRRLFTLKPQQEMPAWPGKQGLRG